MATTKIFEAIPTRFEGVQYRSRLEARFAEYLLCRQIPFEYEPGCFQAVTEKEDNGYIPDFWIGYCFENLSSRHTDIYIAGT